MTEMFEESLKKICPKVLFDEPLSLHTTFKIGGPAKYFCEVGNANEITEIVSLCDSYGVPLYVLGRGSNVIAKDEGYQGLVLHIGQGLSDVEYCEKERVIKAGAGASLASLANVALQNGITGFEPLSGIPGFVGGGVRMNAGAYGGEIKDVLKSVTFIENGVVKIEFAENLALSYRHSIFSEPEGKNKIIVSAEFFADKKEDSRIIAEKMNELAKKRREKQPLEFPSAGSTFKRPEGFFAAKLIEDCGLKGFTVGGACVSEKHAGFVINKGDATSKDIFAVIDGVKKCVFEKTGVMLCPEIEIIQ